MTQELTLIEGGKIYDPTNGIDGVVGNVWISEGKIVPPPVDPKVRPARRIDAKGLVVMPGGVDLHCHIAGSKVNAARRLLASDARAAAPLARTAERRSGTQGIVPSSFATGYLYAGLGYTTAFDAAIAPLAGRAAHLEFADVPCLDKGFYTLIGNNHFLMDAIRQGEPERVREFIAWLLNRVGAYALKLVNPGGVEAWKQRSSGEVQGLDDQVPLFEVSPRQIIQTVAHAAGELNLPHPLHLHCNQLGMPGNWSTTLETMQSLAGLKSHLTHIQFHSYDGGEADEATFGSKVAPLADWVNQHPELTVDVGQVLFGKTISMTGDGPLGYYLANLYRAPWYSCDLEQEAGCGVAPIEYKHKSRVHALQWAIGLEWYLMVRDPWQIAMSTDHPNGASFMGYPQIIQLLMDRNFRREALDQVHPIVRQRTSLADLDREYSLQEICIITRAAPARMLGLTQKGHLGPGADADLTLYSPSLDRQAMFALPRYVIKGGQVLVEDGDLRTPCFGQILRVRPEFDPAIEPPIAKWFAENYSLQLANYGLGDTESH